MSEKADEEKADESEITKREEIPKHEISTTILKLLINGYIRSIKTSMITDVLIINDLITRFYPKQSYIILFDSKTFRLTLIDTEKNIKIFSNKVIALNDDGLRNVRVSDGGVCYKERIKLENLPKKLVKKLLPNGKYNAIFQFSKESTIMLLYSIENSEDFNNLYYYPLPQTPLYTARFHSVVYSDIYGLIALGRKHSSSQIYILDMKNEKWSVQNISPENDLFEQHLYDPPALCFIDSKQLFFVNGGNNYWHNQKAGVYNLETKQLTILNESNYFPVQNCAIIHNKYKNIVYIVGAQGSKFEMKKIRYFDLNTNQFNEFFEETNNPYHERPTLWMNKDDTILNIAGDYPFREDKIHYEWVKLNGPMEWINNEKIPQITEDMFETQNIDYFSVIGCIE